MSTTTTTTTTTTTEILSNSNSSCRLLVCLNSLPFHDQCVFRSLLGHIELLRLSACCRSLRSSIRNDRALWQALYHRDFLSGAYYVKEMDFVLWCIRTDVSNPCTSDKRADLLENVDWYNTYRRRVSTENNWRYGRCNTTYIDMERDKDKIENIRDANGISILIAQQDRSDGASRSSSYILECLPHSNLRLSNNIVYNSTLSTSPNFLSLSSGGNEDQYDYVTDDHYIAVSPRPNKNSININVKILSRKHGGVFTTFDIPVPYDVEVIEGKWALLVHESQESSDDLPIYHIMVFDIDNSVMCPGSIDDTWDTACFYKTTNNTAIVYTARLVEVKDDDTDRIEWALYQFSSNNPVVQLRSGWFQLSIRMLYMGIFAHNLYDSHMIIELYGNPDYDLYVMHSVASSGQSHTPRNCYTISDQHIPIPLLRAGYKYSLLSSNLTKVWTDLSYNDDQVLRIPGTTYIRHIIGDLYFFTIKGNNHIRTRLLVDINTKEIIRDLEASTTGGPMKTYIMFGTIYCPFNRSLHVIQEYGEL